MSLFLTKVASVKFCSNSGADRGERTVTTTCSVTLPALFLAVTCALNIPSVCGLPVNFPALVMLIPPGKDVAEMITCSPENSTSAVSGTVLFNKNVKFCPAVMLGAAKGSSISKNITSESLPAKFEAVTVPSVLPAALAV